MNKSLKALSQDLTFKEMRKRKLNTVLTLLDDLVYEAVSLSQIHFLCRNSYSYPLVQDSWLPRESFASECSKL